jgi:hypothetical protein
MLSTPAGKILTPIVGMLLLPSFIVARPQKSPFSSVFTAAQPTEAGPKSSPKTYPILNLLFLNDRMKFPVKNKREFYQKILDKSREILYFSK